MVLQNAKTSSKTCQRIESHRLFRKWGKRSKISDY